MSIPGFPARIIPATNVGAKASGGDVVIEDVDGVRSYVHTFISNGTFSVTGGPLEVRALLIAGGAGGGAGGGDGYANGGGGGGAGGVLFSGLEFGNDGTIVVPVGNHSVTVGGGGGGGGNTNGPGGQGGNTEFLGIASLGGGGGGGGQTGGRSGGSGGGGSRTGGGAGWAGPPRQGYDGGSPAVIPSVNVRGQTGGGAIFPGASGGRGIIWRGVFYAFGGGGGSNEATGAGANATLIGSGGNGGNTDGLGGWPGGAGKHGICVIYYPVV